MIVKERKNEKIREKCDLYKIAVKNVKYQKRKREKRRKTKRNQEKIRYI